jgi:hypothetical protein
MACMLAFFSLWILRWSVGNFVGGVDFEGLELWLNLICQVILLETSIRIECNLSFLYNFTSYSPARMPLC